MIKAIDHRRSDQGTIEGTMVQREIKGAMDQVPIEGATDQEAIEGTMNVTSNP